MQAALGIMSDELRAGIRARTHSALQIGATMSHPTERKDLWIQRGRSEVVPQQAAVILQIFHSLLARRDHEVDRSRPELPPHSLAGSD